MRRILFDFGGDPRSTLFGVRLSDFEASLATQCCSEFRHYLLRDVDASFVLLVSGFRRCWSSLHLWVHHWKCSGWCRLGSTSTRPSCMLQGFRECQASCRGSSVPLPRVVNAALTLAMCSHARVLDPSQQPSNYFTASFCGGPEVLCGLKSICSPNAAICWLNGLPLMRSSYVTPSPPTWNVVSVQAARLASHLKVELSSPIVAPICHSV